MARRCLRLLISGLHWAARRPRSTEESAQTRDRRGFGRWGSVTEAAHPGTGCAVGRSEIEAPQGGRNDAA